MVKNYLLLQVQLSGTYSNSDNSQSSTETSTTPETFTDKYKLTM